MSGRSGRKPGTGMSAGSYASSASGKPAAVLIVRGLDVGQPLSSLRRAGRERPMRILGIGHEEEGLPGGLRRAHEHQRSLVVQVRIASVLQFPRRHDLGPRLRLRGEHVSVLGHEARTVARGQQGLRQARHVCIDRIEAERATVVRVSSSHPDRAGRLTDGDRHMSVLEPQPFGCQAIDVWRDPEDCRAVDADRIPVHVIDGNEQNVGSRVLEDGLGSG